MKLIGELRKEKEFRQQCCQNSTKIRREKDKKVERERRGISATEKEEEFRQHSYRNSSTQIPARPVKKKQLRQCHCRNRKKKILVIVAMALLKMGKKLNGIMAISLPKMGEKKIVAKIWEEILKKVLRLQYFYNTFTINHR